MDVKRELISVTNWHNLGLVLGLYQYNLEKIKINHRENVDDCMTDMLSEWLKRNDDAGIPSWQRLVIALLDPVVNMPDLAHQIAIDHPKQ